MGLDGRVDDIVEELEPEWREQTIEWRRETLPTVSGDPKMLRLVLVNLIANAIKFTRGREPACISIFSDNSDAREIVVFVRDNGVVCGVKYADQLFRVFKSLHSTSEFEGSGIGLANVKTIVHRHGRRPWATSQAEGGATFCFSLPCGGIYK